MHIIMYVRGMSNVCTTLYAHCTTSFGAISRVRRLETLETVVRTIDGFRRAVRVDDNARVLVFFGFFFLSPFSINIFLLFVIIVTRGTRALVHHPRLLTRAPIF